MREGVKWSLQEAGLIPVFEGQTEFEEAEGRRGTFKVSGTVGTSLARIAGITVQDNGP